MTHGVDCRSAIHIGTEDGTASFRAPQTIEQMTHAVRALLALPAP